VQSDPDVLAPDTNLVQRVRVQWSLLLQLLHHGHPVHGDPLLQRDGLRSEEDGRAGLRNGQSVRERLLH